MVLAGYSASIIHKDSQENSSKSGLTNRESCYNFLQKRRGKQGRWELQYDFLLSLLFQQYIQLYILLNCRWVSKGVYQQGQRPPTRAWVYVLIPKETDVEAEEAEVVTGTIPLLNSLASKRFDSGTTHSFMSSTYAKHFSTSIESLGLDISVATPVGSTILCRQVVRDCSISIEGIMLLTNLVVFKMLGFDVILCMDWLSRHYTSIDYHRKKVVFRWAPNSNLLGRGYELFCPQLSVV